MIIGKIILSTLIIILISTVFSICYIKFYQKDFLGGLKIGILVGITGGILGGFIFDFFFKISFLQQLITIPYIKYLLVNQFDINFIAISLGIWLFLVLYDFVSKHTERS